ncbi:hypothetical protein [Iodobacter fluviatilis]|uniref:Uncharacterized protein n=1 Tax=Iodobacter fluviatilis TaxID=537 RepID=A0A377Q845_9NEIS|nr:hypothetical protein [Iodobacter fluviatilis]TCU88493.1 hypothetical protein EV682_10376 [Iodobacter fluviatilis]STQ91436.1 Uncharacterised protein [Iodobacter fluviatilis]
MPNEAKKVFITCKNNPSLAEKTAKEIRSDPGVTKRMVEEINANKKELKI